MVWQLRQTLRNHFAISFSDPDPVANRILIDHEEKLFLNPNHDELISLEKTDIGSELYESVRFGCRIVQYPCPFLFTVQPVGSHPEVARQQQLSRVLCLYDYAGENCLPGGETASTPRKHLALSNSLFFVFDPTQHPRFRKACLGNSDDSQLHLYRRSQYQEQVLLEAANQIRCHSGLPSDAKYRGPLIVVVTKFDAWRSVSGGDRSSSVRGNHRGYSGVAALDISSLRLDSNNLRELLRRFAPEVVAAAESLSRDVLYVPVSALGVSPEIDAATDALAVRPRDVNPIGVEVPMLYALHKSGLVYGDIRKAETSPSIEPSRGE
jgi:hypothetical protein